MSRGKFIVLEGIDGCGKDTQADFLVKYFRENNLQENFIFVQAIDEKTEKGKMLREIIFNKNFKWTTIPEMLLFWADKFELVLGIEKSLNEGKNVVANRWELSNLAYQIFGKQREDLRGFAELMRDKLEVDVKPDLCILFDISPEESQRRKHTRTEEVGKFEDYYDNATADFMERVRFGYKVEIQKYVHVIINGEQSKEKVFEDTVRAIETIL
jgi:dTMP kinase